MTKLTPIKKIKTQTSLAEVMRSFVFGDIPLDKYDPKESYVEDDLAYLVNGTTGKITVYRCTAATATGSFDSNKWVVTNVIDISNINWDKLEGKPTTWAELGINDIASTMFVENIRNLLDAAIALRATINSPDFTGVAKADTAAPGTNTRQLATTAFVEAVKVALTSAINLKANINSPDFTGTPLVPTAAAGNNSKQIANTAFVEVVRAALAAAIDLKANITSPALLGTPTAPTAAVGNNTQQIATTAFVLAAAVASAAKLTTARNIGISGDGTGSIPFDGSANVNIPLTLANSGVTAGTYEKVTVDSKGRVTSGGDLVAADIPSLDWSKITSGKPTTLAGYGITDGASISYVQGLVEGIKTRTAVKAATTANITLSGAQTIDGVPLVAGDTVLVKNQTTKSQNGIYVVATGAWTRSEEYDEPYEFEGSAFVFVQQGTTQADTGWMCSTNTPLVIGTDAIDFTQFSSAGVANGDNTTIVKTGNVFSQKSGIATAGTYTKVTVDTYGRVVGTTNLVASDIPSLDWSKLTSGIPTTLDGFGITDAVNSADVVTVAAANKILRLNASGQLPAAITGNAATATKLLTARTLSYTGDATGSGTYDGSANTSIGLTLANSGVTAGTYEKVTVDAKGRVTSGGDLVAADIPALDWSKITTGKPTTLAGYGITDAALASSFNQGVKTTDSPTFNGVTSTTTQLGTTNGTILERYVGTFTTTKDVDNQKIDLFMPGSGIIGYLEVTIVAAFNWGNANGRVTKSFSIHTSSGGTINDQKTRYSEVIGPIAGNISIGDVEWDAAASKYKIKLAHRSVSAGFSNSFAVFVKLISNSVSNATTNVSGMVLGEIYTSDTTAFVMPSVSFHGRLSMLSGAVLDDGSANATFRTITSNVPQGTAPLAVSSSTQVANFNSHYLNGYQTSLTAIASRIPVYNASAQLVGDITGNSATATKLATSRTIYLTGDATATGTFDGTGNLQLITTLGASGVTAGTYEKVVVDAKGRVTSGGDLVAADIPGLDWSKITSGKPTTLAGYGITDGAIQYNWSTVAKGLTWSRILMATGANVTGSAMLVNIVGTRGNMVVNATLMVTASHNNAANIVQIGSNSYSTIKVRALGNSSGQLILEIYDNAINSTTSLSQNYDISCTLLKPADLTQYSVFTDGTTVPSGWVVDDEITTIVGSGFLGDLVGNASTATKLATARTLTFTGHATGSGTYDGSGNTSIALSLPNIITAGTYVKTTVDGTGRVTAGSSLAATDIPALDWSKITSGKPTTLAGYGITDAVPSSRVNQDVNTGSSPTFANITTGAIYSDASATERRLQYTYASGKAFGMFANSGGMGWFDWGNVVTVLTYSPVTQTLNTPLATNVGSLSIANKVDIRYNATDGGSVDIVFL